MGHQVRNLPIMTHSCITRSHGSWFFDKVTWQSSSTWIVFTNFSANPQTIYLATYLTQSNARPIQLRKTFLTLDLIWGLIFYRNSKPFELDFTQCTIAGPMLHAMDYAILVLLLGCFIVVDFSTTFAEIPDLCLLAKCTHTNKQFALTTTLWKKQPKFFHWIL